jgi:hypothetical protein
MLLHLMWWAQIEINDTIQASPLLLHLMWWAQIEINDTIQASPLLLHLMWWAQIEINDTILSFISLINCSCLRESLSHMDQGFGEDVLLAHSIIPPHIFCTKGHFLPLRNKLI